MKPFFAALSFCFVPVVLLPACDDGPDAPAGAAGASNSGGSSAGSSGTAGSTALRVPKNHRPTAEICADRPSQGPSPEPVKCDADADCVEGARGICIGAPGGRCSYQDCLADADCSGGLCVCGSGANVGNDFGLSASCRTDADCGGSFCSPSEGQCGSYSGVVTYACHGPKDTCTDDADGATQGGGTCRFQQAVGYWKCAVGNCVG